MFYLDQNKTEFKEMGLEGALMFVVGRAVKSRYIMMYSIHNYERLFYTELYVDFQMNFVKINELFYAFPWEDMVIGISFGEKEGKGNCD